jgi:hypothetical protein
MKTLKIEKNRVFLRYELSDRVCDDILANSQGSLRFDLTYMDEDVNLKTWRAVVKKSAVSGLSVLEIRDYDQDDRTEIALSPSDTLLDASTIALRQVWAYIEEHPDQFPKTGAMPVLSPASAKAS